MCHQPPNGCDGGGVGFAGSVAGSNGDVAVLVECVKDFALFFPRISVEEVFGEPYGGFLDFRIWVWERMGEGFICMR